MCDTKNTIDSLGISNDDILKSRVMFFDLKLITP